MRRKSRFPVRIILFSIFCFAPIFLLLFLSYRYLTTSGYFKIKDSEYFGGQNIFKIDLKTQAQRLSNLYPDYKHITLKRRLPDRIVIDFNPRQPVARIALSRDFYVDDEGVLFYPERESKDNSQLPLIVGLDERISSPRSGAKFNEKSLLAILEFIDNLNKDSRLTEAGLKIKEINLANANDVFLFTSDGCKINLGGIESLNKDLSILQRLISEINFDLTKIEYIDLRFREPVVKYR